MITIKSKELTGTRLDFLFYFILLTNDNRLTKALLITLLFIVLNKSRFYCRKLLAFIYNSSKSFQPLIICMSDFFFCDHLNSSFLRVQQATDKFTNWKMYKIIGSNIYITTCINMCLTHSDVCLESCWKSQKCLMLRGWQLLTRTN